MSQLEKLLADLERLEKEATDYALNSSGDVFMPLTAENGIPLIPQKRSPIPMSKADLNFYTFSKCNAPLLVSALRECIGTLEEIRLMSADTDGQAGYLFQLRANACLDKISKMGES
jgi:hypothetical protein